MPAVFVVIGVLIAFFLAYRFYSRYLAEKVYALDKNFRTPAHEFEDGVDYVPTNKHVLFGHHFTSVAGAAPIVGPAIAVFWGWVPALLWVVLGTIFAAGVHDFGSLVVSVRNRAQNIGTLTQRVITPRARTLFLLIIFFLLTLVNAVFAVVMAILFEANPGAVIPAVLIIPLAIAVGQLAYRRRVSLLVPTIVAVALLYAFIPVGQAFPIRVDGLANALGLEVRTTWVILIFIYTWFASRLPVWLLLQPRDYLNSYQLFIALGVIFLGVAVGFDRIVAPALNTNLPEGSPNWFPFLFITIACGAISGFHSLVSSGTTSKQLDNEEDARYVGYMGALGEGSLAVASILAATAGIGTLAVWQERYANFGLASDNAVGNFTEGVGHFANNLGIPVSLGTIFAAVVVITFAGTTMDTGIRLQRYIIQEIGEIVRVGSLTRNITLTTTIAVLIPLGLALFPGGGETGGFVFGRLWRLFGTTNQLTAGLALSIIAVWVFTRGRNPIAQIVPLTFLLIMTTWALFIQLGSFYREGDWLLTILDGIIFVLALWLIIEAIAAFRRAREQRRAGRPAGAGEGGGPET
ncbi:carbon starvation protein A [Rubrobacter xylanophilus]|uniref:Carbon starvation protein A n=1 Tax=Rubrobacter xylanophilus TaxID=49319 RepID=A0A510HM25_9ACTN|nr:carbon starvation protein A [Rubrobacter xylanophilus]BBL80964.1 carbon starvation protein A [Rubrobacter xylanophilus]